MKLLKEIEWINSAEESDFLEFAKDLDLVNKSVNKRLILINDRKKREAEKLAQEKYLRLCKEVEYTEPSYPQFDYDKDEMGEEDSPGSCFFSSETQAKEFINAIVSQSSYYYGHTLKWSGEGRYKINPSWKYDCSGEIIYTATYAREIL